MMNSASCCVRGCTSSSSTTEGAAPSVVEDDDVQPLTQQLAEFIIDPLQDPLRAPQSRGNASVPGNTFASWMRTESVCGGTGAGSTYFLLDPTNTNPKNN